LHWAVTGIGGILGEIAGMSRRDGVSFPDLTLEQDVFLRNVIFLQILVLSRVLTQNWFPFLA
jgi:hypothetical protein